MKVRTSLMRDAALVLLAALTVVTSVYVLTRQPATDTSAGLRPPALTSPSTAPSPAEDGVRALLIGSEPGLADALESLLGWSVDESVLPGTGFISGSPTQSFVGRVPGLLRASDADVVVLEAGTAEGEGPDLRRYSANVAFLLDAARQALPDARVVLVGPVAPRPDAYGEVRDQLIAVAARFGAVFVDPIARYAATTGVVEPGGSLTAPGRREISRLVARDLQKVLPADLLQVPR